MIDRLSFDSPLSAALVLVIASVVWIVVVFFELRSSYKFKWPRLASLTVFVCACALIVLRPSYRSAQVASPLLVLTDNYSQEKADSIARVTDVEVVSTVTSKKIIGNVRRVTINELATLSSRIAFVLGDGLPASILNTDPALSFFYAPSAKNSGIRTLHIPRITVGMPSRIKGTVHPNTPVTSLKLAGPGGLEDSVQVNPSTGTFELLLEPRQAGLFVYHLQGDSLDERVPIEVKSTKQLRILFLQKFPTFETRQLKDFLGKQGHSVVLRNQVSKNTLRYEYVNALQNPPSRLSAAVLNSFDLVIVSQETIDELPASELTAMDESIRGGLGVIILFQNNSVKNSTRKIFSASLAARDVDTVSIEHFSWEATLSVHTAPVELAPKASVEVVWRSTNGNAIVGFQRLGIGKVGFQFLDQTYHLVLEGKSKEYSLLWSTILNETARRGQPTTDISLESNPPFFVGEPLSIEAVSRSGDLDLFFDDIEMPLREDEWIDDVWTTTVWPTQPGWHRLLTTDSVSVPFFVFNKGEWESLKAMRMQAENQRHHSLATKAILREDIDQPVNLVYLFMLLILAGGFLWLSPKL